MSLRMFRRNVAGLSVLTSVFPQFAGKLMVWAGIPFFPAFVSVFFLKSMPIVDEMCQYRVQNYLIYRELPNKSAECFFMDIKCYSYLI